VGKVAFFAKRPNVMPNANNNNSMKTALIKSIGLNIIFVITILITSSVQTFNDELKQIIKSIDDTWTVDIDTETNFNHITLKSGTFVGLMRLKKNNDLIEYYIYKPLNDNLTNEILHYHTLASCALSGTDYKYEILKFKDYLLFLPMYPCWSNGYSEDGKKLIVEMVSKLK
jgi:hypothetical protein